MMKNPIHPASAMCIFWIAILFIYCFGPVALTPKMSFQGGLFLFAHITLFIAGSGFAFILLNRKHDTIRNLVNNEVDCVSHLIPLLLLIGIAGGLLSLYNSLASTHGISLALIAKLRALKAQNILHGGQTQSTVLSAIAFLTYPAGFVGLVAGVLQYEHISRGSRALMYLFVATIFGVAFLAGGRSPVLLLLLFTGLSCYTRKALGKPWMPRSRVLRLGTVLLLLAFIVYSSIMWGVRAAESERTTEQALQYAADVGGAKPRPYMLAASQWLNKPGLTLSTLNSVFYLTQSLPVTEKILAARKDLHPMYGSYHVDVIAAGLRLFPQGSAFLRENYATLLHTKIYGYFPGAWGALFIDYGYFSLLAAMIWGFLAGAAWVKFKNNPGVFTGIFYVFWNYSILICFVSPPFGFSNSFMVFAWFLVFYFLGVRHQRKTWLF